ncbi:MAG TPA: TonB-dependent receptor [Terriglobales bacterium]|nr:TonB-dependent receptor [Terriglobales bacterium]
MSGTVTDPSGAVISNAKVTAKNLGTGLTRSVTSSGNGAYTIVNLPPGRYDVSVETAGFETFKQTIDVTVGGRSTVDAALKVGTQGTIVEVTAENAGAQVNTQDQQISNTVTSAQIEQLPSLTRNPYDFVSLSGNVSANTNVTADRGVGVSINGQRSASTDILLDGNQNVDLFGAGVGQAVPLDSVQEYKVITSDFSAQYGRASGGIVNVATKSGTNSYHGTVYEFNRLSALAANTYQEDADAAIGSPDPADHFTRNQFGYSVGGPVLPRTRDKLFFFSSTEWTRVRSSGAQFANVVTPQFLALTSPTTQNYFKTFGPKLDATPTGQTSTYSQVVAPTSKFFNAATAAQLGATPIFQKVAYITPSNAGAGDPQNTYSNVDRVDWNLTDRTQFFGRYAYQNENFFAGVVNASPYAGYNTGEVDRNHNALLSMNHIFSPTILSTTKLSYQRLFDLQPLNGAPAPTLYFDRSNTTSFANGTQVAFPGYTEFSPGNGIPFGGPQNLYELDQDLSITRGSHTLRFGGQYIHIRDNRVFGAYENPVQVAGEESNGDSGIQGLLQGLLFNNSASFQGAIFPQGKFPCLRDVNTGSTIVTPACTLTTPVSSPSFERNNRFNDGAVYAQDDWKATTRLTLNLGIRWEYYGVQHNADPSLESNFYLGSGSNLLQRVRNGQVLTTPNSPTGGISAQDFKNFAPRVGFAFDPTGSGKWSVRGGYGIAYERNFGNVTYNVIQNPPNYGVIALASGCGTPAPAGCTHGAGDTGTPIAIQTSTAGPLAGSGVSKPFPQTSLRAVDPNIKTAYAQIYSFAVEHQVLPSTLLAVEFSGSRGEHLYGIVNLNKAGFGEYLGDTRANRLNLGYTNINFRDSVGDSYYNGVNVRLQSSNFANAGLTLTANYTYAHSLDDLSTTFSETGNSFNLGFTNPFLPKQDLGNSDYDVRHRLAFGAFYEPTFLAFKNSSRFVQDVFGGFQFAPIFTVRTGTPFTIFDCSNAGVSCPRVEAAADLPYTGTPTAVAGSANLYDYITLPADAANPSLGFNKLGSDYPVCNAGGLCTINAGVGKDAFHSPNNWKLDLGVYKTIKITERVGFQLRGEFYNVLNHHNQYVVVGNADFSSAPTVQTAKGAVESGIPGPNDERRNIQIGAKIIF